MGQRIVLTVLGLLSVSLSPVLGKCPENYWQAPVDNCVSPLHDAITEVQQRHPVADVRINITCRAWEQTKMCFEHLMGDCEGDQNAIRDLNLTLTRYVVHSLPCYSEELKERQRVLDCYVTFIPYTRWCTDAFDMHYHRYVVNGKYIHACSLAMTLIKCYHMVKMSIKKACHGVGAAEFHKNYIRPVVKEIGPTVVSKCTIPAEYKEYFGSGAARFHSNQQIVTLATVVLIAKFLLGVF